MNMFGLVGDLFIRNTDILSSRYQQHNDKETVTRLRNLIRVMERAKGAVVKSS